ncbi:SDR family oxidoreductase [Sphingorhabdus sp. IMCC26285]|uniref:SDR family oxidoreductase n=1 Tax=Sphingorhabdus profundilacus TaxID=2509718 RepID=A0A6I4LUS9_9SPHN|nr:SDR family NAD(P)-dependent oxidoreductase [Sphingorhabdus profundilacus]MVZ96559.1 SDR family oxidoreductase [Sphingorhabdus profundilacus]
MKVALVTGAAQGVGFATAKLLAETGHHVVMTDLQDIEVQANSLIASGGKVSALSGDISSESFVIELARKIAAEHEAADILVNNAGISLIQSAEDTTIEQWQRVMGINLTGPFLLCREMGRQMLARGRGNIVNVASIAGLHGIIDRSAYNASKHGLIGLTRTLAAEWGGRGVRVNAVCPGWIKTEMDAADQGSGAYSDDDIVNRVPMARFAKPEDVAKAIAFLAQEDSFINGVTLPVDGGWIADASWETLRLESR